MRTSLSFKTILIGTLLLGAFSGCGPGATAIDPNKKVFFDTFSTGGSVPVGCRSLQSPNIIPIYDTTVDGSRHYATCFNSATPSIVRVLGHSSLSDWVCAYPITTTGITTFTPVKDVNGIPVSQCWSASAAGTAGQTLNYYFSGFNALIIVDYDQRMDMSRCLINGQTCPNNFSVGEL